MNLTILLYNNNCQIFIGFKQAKIFTKYQYLP